MISTVSRIRKVDWVDYVTDPQLLKYEPGDGGYVHSRNSTGTYRDRDGVLQTAASGVLRDDHWVQDETGLWVRSTLLESSRTNNLTRSEALDNAAWTKTRCSISANQAVGPDGATNLDEVIEDSSTNTHFLHQNVTLTGDANYSFSCWAIANTRTWIAVQVYETADAANRFRAWFNLSLGAVGTTEDNGTGTFGRAYVEDWTGVEAGLYRCVCVGSVGNSATAISARVYLTTGDGNEIYAGDGSSSAYMGYVQIEDASAFASSYIPTAGSTASRAADNPYLPFTAAPQAMTVQVKFVELGAVHDTVGLFKIGSGSVGGDPRFLVRSAGSVYRIEHDNGTTTPAANLGAAPSIGDTTTIRAVLNLDGSVLIGQSVNGAAETTADDATTATLQELWADTRLYLNSRGSSSIGHNAFIYVKVAKGVRSMDYMEAL